MDESLLDSNRFCRDSIGLENAGMRRIPSLGADRQRSRFVEIIERHSSRAAKGHNRQVLAILMIGDVQVETVAGPSRNRNLGLRTGRATRPLCSRFDSRPSVGREVSTKKDIAWCLAGQRHVRAMHIVPFENQKEFAARGSRFQRNQDVQRPPFVRGTVVRSTCQT